MAAKKDINSVVARSRTVLESPPSSPYISPLVDKKMNTVETFSDAMKEGNENNIIREN